MIKGLEKADRYMKYLPYEEKNVLKRMNAQSPLYKRFKEHSGDLRRLVPNFVAILLICAAGLLFILRGGGEDMPERAFHSLDSLGGVKASGKADDSRVRDILDEVSGSLVSIVPGGNDGLDVDIKNNIGIILSEDGYILAPFDIANDSSELHATLSDGREFEATCVGRSVERNLAILKIDATHLDRIVIRDSDLESGEEVFSIRSSGFCSRAVEPMLGSIGIGGIETVFTAKTRLSITELAGCALLDSTGRLAGLLTDTGEDAWTCSVLQASSLARTIYDIIFADKFGSLVDLGFDAYSISMDEAGARGLVSGIFVETSTEGMPAYKAGIKHGDVIVEISGFRIYDLPQLMAVLRGYKPGDTVVLTIWREGEMVEIEVKT